MKRRIFYGYPMIVVLGLMYFCSSGLILPAANVLNPLMLADESMGLTATVLGAGFSVFVLFQGFSAPLAGAVISRKGVRFTMTVGAAVLTLAACAMAFFVSSPIAYFIMFGVLASVGSMMAGQVSTQSAIGEWFVAKRGVAMTVMMIIGASASFVVPALVEVVVRAMGGSWRAGWYLIIAFAVCMIPMALFLVKNRPSEIGQLPDGAESEGELAKSSLSFKVYKRSESLPFSKVLRTPSFWLISLAATGGFVAYTFTTAQGVLHFTTLGIDRVLIVAGVSIMGGATMIGKVVMGSLSDRVEPIRIVSAAGFVLAAGLLLAAAAANEYMMYAYYFLIGFGFGGLGACFPTAMANYFGPGSFSKNLGTGIFVTTIVASTLPIMGGALFDAMGSCVLAYFITTAIVVVCAICGLLVRIPSHRAS